MLKRFITCISICISICIYTTSYAESITPNTSQKEIEEQQKKLLRYVTVTPSKESVATFDVDAAVAAGEDRVIIELGLKFNEFSRAMSDQMRDHIPVDGKLSIPNICADSSVAIELPEEIKKQQEILLRYVTTPKEGYAIFDVNAAVAADEDRVIIELGLKFNEFSRAMSNPTRDGIPFYGNWCGLGHGGEHGDPIDTLDSLCQMHDECYAANGYFNCGCNATLRAQISYYLGFSWMYGVNEEQKIAAQTIMTFFLVMPCF